MTNCPSTPKPFRADGGDISTGRLKEIADNPYGDEEKCWLAKRVLASLEVEPVAWTDGDELRDVKNGGSGYLFAIGGEANKFADPHRQVMLYTAPPAPVSVPDEDLLHMAASAIEDLLSNKDRSGAGVWADVPAKLRRTAMLHGANGNSPVIPDGWKLVPIVPTEKMVIEGFESEPDEFFSKSEVWEAYQKMSGCEQAAHRAKLCWAAMISTAPQQEVKL